MRRTRNAKIIATLGPASSDAATIARLFEAGADVFRFNFSHGAHDDHKRRFEIVRGLEQQYGRPIGVLADLQGPKLRVGKFKSGPVTLQTGQPLRLDLSTEPGDETRVCLPHPEIFRALSEGTDLLLDDGRIRLKVLKSGDDFAETEVAVGGPLSNHKGVNVPSAVLGLSPLTAKDREDLQFALDLGVDWVALSFIQRPDDIAEARKLIQGRAAVMSKLEKPAAIHHLNEIVELSDAVMVARGDLGVEMPPEAVPAVQKRIIRACRVAGKPVIVATQMLDSMVNAPTPTRAEASDVATAVYDGSDCVMLSAETAAGKYPGESVAMMDRIIKSVEQDPLFRRLMDTERHLPELTAADAITAAARQVAQTISAAAIVTFSSTGSTTVRCARERPSVPILGLTPRPDTSRKVCLAWGVHSVLTEEIHTFREMVERAVVTASQEGFAKSGDRIVVTAGVPFGTPGATNILRIAWVEVSADTEAGRAAAPIGGQVGDSWLGAACAFTAFAIWGTMPIYFKAVEHVLPSEVAAHRALWSAAALAVLLVPLGRSTHVRIALANRRLLLRLTASAAVLGGSWVVYIWAVNNDRIVESSLGYFINPLFNVILGVLLLKETLRRWQWLAVGLAAAGVGVLVVEQGAVPWVALVLPFLFGLYGLLRKVIQVDPMAGLLVETLMMCPFAIGWLGYLSVTNSLSFVTAGVSTNAILAVAGALTAGPLLLFIYGARHLTLSTLGFFQYIAPTGNLMLGVFAYGEPFTAIHQAAFGLIWVALAIYTADTVRARARAKL